MNFGELRFWVILFSGLGFIFAGRVLVVLMRKGALQVYDKATLGILGLYMLGIVSWLTLTIYGVVILTTYFGLKLITKRGHGSVHWLWFLIPLQLAPLFYYKYARFIVHEVLGQSWNFFHDIAIPVGISFYTFQTVSFAVDTLIAHKPIPRLLDFINFVGFFPQLVAGPIERRENLLPQMQSFQFRWLPISINEGVPWIAVGLFFKCCLADNLATFFDPSRSDAPLSIWKQNLLFGLRIYYDFAGYSLIAVGIAKCLGIELTLNFLSPYCARSPVEFWRRWHITLSQWFRDYIYVPMGGARVRWWVFNVLLVFVVSGIWHGAGWNFLIWGLLHALFLIANRLVPQKKSPPFLGWALTLGLAFYAWLSFYETRPTVLFEKMTTISNPLNYSASDVVAAVKSLRDPNIYVATCFLLMSGVTLFLEWLSLHRGNAPYSELRRPSVVVVLVILTIWLAPGKTNDFIYFAF
jgi:alginate O-acetyltransferase complex protein AlgI